MTLWYIDDMNPANLEFVGGNVEVESVARHFKDAKNEELRGVKRRKFMKQKKPCWYRYIFGFLDILNLDYSCSQKHYPLPLRT